MSDFVIIEQDTVKFGETYGTVSLQVPKTGKMIGSGPAIYQGNRKVCVQGDEARVIVPGCLFQGANHSAPGTGLLKIKELDSRQIAEKTKSGGKAVILKGTQFTAVLEVIAPPALPDGTPDTGLSGARLEGTGEFMTTNKHYKAT